MSRYLTSRRMKRCQSWECHAPFSVLCDTCGKGFCDSCGAAHERKHPPLVFVHPETVWPT